MNFNNRQRTPALVPRALRPKAVCVSPIQSPIRGIVPRPVIPVMSPQGRGQYVLGGSVVPQVYPGGSVPRNITATQTRFATQTRVDAQTRLAAQTRLDAQARLGAQSRMTAQAIFAQRGVPQTVSAAQQQINTRALSAQGTVGRIAPQPQVLYPRVAAMAQNSPAAQPRNSSHALYQQSAAMSQTGPRPRMAGQVLIPQPVQVGNRVPMPQPNVPMLVPRAPVYQNVTFQQGRQLAYQAQVRPQIQAGPQLAFQARRQLNQTVPTAIFNRNAASIASPFQTTSQISINPAYIAAHRRALSQRSSRAVVQPNIPTIVRMKAIQHVSQNQATNKVVEVNNDLSVISMEQSDVSASLSNNMSVSDESLPCIVEMPDTCTEGQDESLEDAVNPGINLLTGFNSDTYKQVTLNEDMLSIAQDHALLQETSTEYNPQVSPDDVEILSLHHPVEKELPTITHNSMDTAESSVLYGHSGVLANGTEQILTSMDSSRQPFTQTVDNVHQDMEANNGEIDPYIQIIPIGESDNSESSDLLTGLQSSTNSRTDILPENSSETTVLHDSEAINSESFHSVASQKTSLLLETDPISQQGSCDDSQGVDDAYTDDSNSMTWEHFHQSVLNLRAKTDQGETNGSYSLNDERSFGTDYSSCAIGGPMNGSAEINVDNDQPIDAVNMDQSFEGDDDLEFVWEDYLQQTGATAVPPSAFKHVEHSLQSGFIKGMKLEVPNKSDPSTYWVASVQMTCGPLLRLRYDGYGDESSADFWCDLATTEVHHIGWSAQTGKNLQPPDELKDSVSDWRTFLLESLTGARTAPLSFLEKGAGTSPVDQLKCGMKLELQDILNPLQVWLVQILENVGGRLYLRLEGTQSASKHFWMFYLDPRLHPIGWVNDQEGCIYRPPPDIYDEQTDESWTAFLQTALKECEDDLVPDDIFKEQQQLKCHQFTVGMKLEALNPGRNTIGPATVTKVINNKYFIVELDDVRHLQDRVQICCNTEYLGIFPISWCQCKGIRLTPPRGWSGGDFVWGEYLSICSAKAAPERLFNSGTDEHDFERGMKLEAVNPDTSSPNQICAATITKIVGPLLWIHLDHMRDIPSHIEDIDSHNLFPVGWCESNHYQLKPPVKAKPRQKHTAECKTEEVYRSITSCQTKGAWCPKIFFNHRCFSGPYLSKGRISDLPKHVGPGPMHLVLREVLSLLIGIAYVPCRALKEIQHDGAFNPNMKAQILKAKYKGKRYKAVVEVCQRESQLEEYCRNMCIKLECCPYIFSPLYVRHNCPENCQQLVKSKSTQNDLATTIGRLNAFGLMETPIENKLLLDDETATQFLKCAYFIAKRDLPRDEMKHMMNFVGDNVVGEMRQLMADYSSRDSVSDFQRALADVILEDTIEQIKGSGVYSIVIEEGGVTENIKCLLLRAQYATPHGVVHCFLANRQVTAESGSAESVVEMVLDELETKGLDVMKMVGIGTEGGRIMTDRKTGVVAQLKGYSPALVGVHCAGHRTALAMSMAAEHVEDIENYSRTLVSVFRYFSSSSLRFNHLHEIRSILNLPELNFTDIRSVKWLSMESAISAIYRAYPALCMCLECEATEECTARGLYEEVCQYKFIALTHMMMDIIPFVTRLSKTFQSQALDFSRINPLVQSTCETLKDLVECEGVFVDKLSDYIEEKSGKMCYVRPQAESESNTVIETVSRNVDVEELDETEDNVEETMIGNEEFDEADDHDEETVIRTLNLNELDGSEVNGIEREMFEFHPELRLYDQQQEIIAKVLPEYVDKVVENIESRFQDTEILSAMHVLVPANIVAAHSLAKYGISEMKDLVRHYSIHIDGNIDPCLSEYRQYKRLVSGRYRNKTLVEIMCEIEKKYRDMLPNILVLLKCCVVLPVSCVQRDSRRYTLNQIQSKLRMSENYRNLDDLVRISEDGSATEEFDFGRALQKWRSVKVITLRDNVKPDL